MYLTYPPDDDEPKSAPTLQEGRRFFVTAQRGSIPKARDPALRCWSALVVTVQDGGGRPVVVQEWVEAERLRPVRSDPSRRQLGY